MVDPSPRCGELTASYVHGVSMTPLLGLTVGALFDRTAERWPDNLALVVRHQEIRWTYRELKREVDDFAAGLVALRLEPGDRLESLEPAECVVPPDPGHPRVGDDRHALDVLHP